MNKRQAFETLKVISSCERADDRQEEESGKSTIAYGRYYSNCDKYKELDILFDGVQLFNEINSDRYHAILEEGDKYIYVYIITLEYLVDNFEKLSKEFNGLPDLEKTKKIINIL